MNKSTLPSDCSPAVTRRQFVRSAAVGTGLVLTQPLWARQAAANQAEDILVAIIGPGSQGLNLVNNCLKIPGVRFKAVCDIWAYSQKYASNLLKKYDQIVNVYSDYQEMLAKETDLDAVIVATPDWVHAEQTVACLKTGKHVYCEKEMSNTIDGARSMVQAARESGKLLQIGHQRRSNPRYWHAIKLIEKDKVLGRITHFYGQWNRGKRYEIGWPKGQEMPDADLKKHGYDTMERFRNWRWCRKFSGGAIADLGSHQIDVFNWILRTTPKSVLAAGGIDYYPTSEWYDNILAIYEYDVAGHTVRGFYQVLNSTSHGNFYEVFMGDEGSMEMSEDTRRGQLLREPAAKRREWEDMSEKVESMGRDAIELKIGETLAPDGKKDPEGQRLLEESKKPVHQLHLENFFNAVRTGSALSCPPEVGFETCVSVLAANDAVASGQRLNFKPEMFKA